MDQHVALVRLCSFAFCVHPAFARAQPKQPGPAPEPPQAPAANAPAEDEEQGASDSPRASLTQYVALTRAGHYREAAKFLEVPRDLKGQEAQLAERLKAVLDRRAWIDLDKISPLSTGNLDDGLPRAYEEIARFQENGQVPEPVRLVKRDAEGGIWRFTAGTVANVNGWYAKLEDRWLRQHLPAWLLRTGPRDLLIWQWLALPLFLLVAWGVGYLLSRVSECILLRVARHTSARWDDQLIQRLGHPFTMAWTTFALLGSLPFLELYQPALEFLRGVLFACAWASLFWMLARGIGVWGLLISLSPQAQRISASRTLIPLGTRLAHVALFTLAVLTILSQLGYSVTSLIAGLGLGGLAVALAAQKTLENLFGAFAIGVDQPFREGDSVHFEDITGTVEAIGLRSTRIRTPDRTLVSIPNGKLSDMRIESFAARDRFRFYCTLSLAYGTPPAKIRQVLAALEQTLGAQPKLSPGSASARLLQIGTSSVDLEIAAWFGTLDGAEFQAIRQELLLAFMDVVREADAELALPVQAMQIVPRSRREEGHEHAALSHE